MKKQNKQTNIFFSTEELISEIKIPSFNLMPTYETFLQYDLGTYQLPESRQFSIEEKGLIKIMLSKRKKASPKPPNPEQIPPKNKKHVDPLVGLSLNLNYNISPAKCLSIPFTKNNEGKIKCYLNEIQLSTNEIKKVPTYGFISSFNLLITVPFEIINHTTHEMEYCEIKRVNELILEEEEFKLIVLHHMKLCYDCYLLKNLTEEDIELGISRLFNKHSKEKKYIIVPVKENSFLGTLEINYDVLQHCKKMFYANNDNKNNLDSLESLLLRYYEENPFSNIPSNQLQTNFIKDFLSKYVFVTQYRNWNIYEMFDIFYPNENFPIFLEKLTCGNKKYSERVLNKYFDKILPLNQEEVKTKEIMTTFPTKAQSVTEYRMLDTKYNIKINPDPIGYAYGKKMYFIYDSYIYNKVVIKNKLKNEQDDKKNIVYGIFPIDIMLVGYFTKQDLEMVYKFPSIFTNFESMLIPYEFIIDLGCFNLDLLNYEKYKYFLWGFTTATSLQDYDYETLETLGDSILKVLTTTTLYLNDKYEGTNLLAGQLEKNRQYFISNRHLFHKGKYSEIFNYILSKDMDMRDYEFPLKVLSDLEYHMNITEKTMADIVEATLGAIYLYDYDLRHCYYFFKKIDILNSNHIEEGDKDNKWFSCITNEILYHQVYESLTVRKEFKYPDISLIPINISILELLSLYGNQYYYDELIEDLNDLQNLCLKYNFKNKELLNIALTHKSINSDPHKNYENLEFLGDSIVESFISCSLFRIFANYLYNNKDIQLSSDSETTNKDKIMKIKYTKGKIFNNVFMTHIKSLLCSNAFMCKLSSFLHLPKFVKCGYNSLNNKIKAFMEKDNIDKILNRKLSDYEDYNAFTPKIIADIFESIVGAIYIDSNIEKCYEFLSMMYSPFIAYSAEYFDELKYSIVNDFTLLAENRLKSVPEFIIKEDNKEEGFVVVEIFLNGELLTSGCGNNLESAKQQASIRGVKIIHQKIDYD